ncbi:MAG: transcriptional repressor [Bacteroides sp.]|nr:transcriptional repressor [Bacteroides sp.]MCM1550614.1 transcriptional repressor [Clostridium sp.]
MEYQWPTGMKRTRQREDVFRVLTQAEEPLTAMEIYQRVRSNAKDANYAISTIYRALSVFEEKELLEKTTLMGEDMAVYAWKGDVHKHYAICLICRRKLPLGSCPMEQLQLSPGLEDFTVTGHKLELYGYCKACKNNIS